MGQSPVYYADIDRKYSSLSIAELQRLAAERNLAMTQRHALLQADRATLLSLLKAYDAGMADAIGRDDTRTDPAKEAGEGVSDADTPEDKRDSCRDQFDSMVGQQVLDAPGPKGVDIGGTLVKVALALPARHTNSHNFPANFGLTGRTRYDLEFEFKLHSVHTGYVLRFVSGATTQLEQAVGSVKSHRKRQDDDVAGAQAKFEFKPANRQEGSVESPTASTSDEPSEEKDSAVLVPPANKLDERRDISPNTRSRFRQRLGTVMTTRNRTQRLFTAGGGAHKFAPLFKTALEVELTPVKELSAVVDGLLFLNVYGQHANSLFTIGENGKPTGLPWPDPLFPFILVNIGSGVSILRVDSAAEHDYVRVGGTACGGSTFLGLARALTSAESFQQALELAEKGDATRCDLLVEDIYGQEGSASLGLPGTLTASNFGRLSDMPPAEDSSQATEHDMARSLLQMVTQQSVLLSSAYAKQAGCVDRVFFVGGFVEEENHLARVAIANNFRSLGGCAYFLRHSDYLGALGSLRACLRGDCASPRCG